MSRFFSGSRDSGTKKSGSASSMMMDQLRKGKRINVAENYKKILEQKLAEARLKAASGEKQNFSIFSRQGAPKEQSKRTQEIVKMMLEREKMKKEKEARKAVYVKSQRLANGKIDEKGRVYDIAGNLVGKVNPKNGNISTAYGMVVGKYKEKSYSTKVALENLIHKNSPFLINQRRLQDIKQREAMSNTSFWGGVSGHDIWGNPIS